jgi:hypothetical protein
MSPLSKMKASRPRKFRTKNVASECKQPQGYTWSERFRRKSRISKTRVLCTTLDSAGQSHRAHREGSLCTALYSTPYKAGQRGTVHRVSWTEGYSAQGKLDNIVQGVGHCIHTTQKAHRNTTECSQKHDSAHRNTTECSQKHDSAHRNTTECSQKHSRILIITRKAINSSFIRKITIQ